MDVAGDDRVRKVRKGAVTRGDVGIVDDEGSSVDDERASPTDRAGCAGRVERVERAVHGADVAEGARAALLVRASMRGLCDLFGEFVPSGKR